MVYRTLNQTDYEQYLHREFHMISSTTGKRIRICITTYKPISEKKEGGPMDSKTKKPGRAKCNLCSICLVAKPGYKQVDCNNTSKSCPICQKNCDYCHTAHKRDKDICNATGDMLKVKDAQTSDTNVAQGLNLLNEVLTVFQNKKEDLNREKIKSVPSKDKAVATDTKNSVSRLTTTSFYFSIDEWKRPENGVFIIVNSYQPEVIRNSQHAIELIKHKSSSIPQMKLEELKYSVRQKTRSKDAIEEVNRMFATVRKSDKHFENSNRPVVRSGPRVLPVVKCENTVNTNLENSEKNSCRCHHTCMSSGDSRPDCCHDTNCGKNVYRLCCHYQNKGRQSLMLCDCCNKNDYIQYENCDDCS